ncbi:hypothetical protein GCM10009780_64450 [Actinomadura alba]
MPAEASSLGCLALIALTVLGNHLLDMIKRRQDEGGTEVDEGSGVIHMAIGSLAGGALLPVAERMGCAKAVNGDGS